MFSFTNPDELQEAEEESPNRSKARLVTTAANPYTINAEIYEVHPDSRERITTTLATSLKTVAPGKFRIQFQFLMCFTENGEAFSKIFHMITFIFSY